MQAQEDKVLTETNLIIRILWFWNKNVKEVLALTSIYWEPELKPQPLLCIYTSLITGWTLHKVNFIHLKTGLNS